MRLTELEKDGLLLAIKEYVKSDFKLRLYGSRLDNNLKGGDIDLILMVDNDLVPKIKWNKHKILVAMKSKIGEQKIDLSISSNELLLTDLFLNLIYEKSQVIE